MNITFSLKAPLGVWGDYMVYSVNFVNDEIL